MHPLRAVAKASATAEAAGYGMEGSRPVSVGSPVTPAAAEHYICSQCSCGFARFFRRGIALLVRSRLLLLCHRLEVREEQPLRYGAGKRLVGCDVAYLADVDVADDDFGGSFLVLPMAVEGDGGA